MDVRWTVRPLSVVVRMRSHVDRVGVYQVFLGTNLYGFTSSRLEISKFGNEVTYDVLQRKVFKELYKEQRA